MRLRPTPVARCLNDRGGASPAESRHRPLRGSRRRVVGRFVLVPLLSLGFLLSLPAGPAWADHPFGQGAGWEKARTEPRSSILVWADPGLHIDLPAVIEPWNRLAGWELFDVVRSPTRADVLFRPSAETWVQCDPSYGEAYTRCVVWSATSSTTTHRHEIGHALGFADHVEAGVYGEGGHVNPAVCDDAAHPAYSGYVGVVSYCDWTSGHAWFGPEDRRMLAMAGYLGAGPLDDRSSSSAAEVLSAGGSAAVLSAVAAATGRLASRVLVF